MLVQTRIIRLPSKMYGILQEQPELRGQSEHYSLNTEMYYHPDLLRILFHAVSGPQWGRLQNKMLPSTSH